MKKIYLFLLFAAAVSCTPEEETTPDVKIPNPYEVENIANADDPTANTLESSLINKFGEVYVDTLKQVKVVGSINSADFASLLTFEEIDLSEVEVVGAVAVFPGEDPLAGNAIPMSGFLPNVSGQPTGANEVLKKVILPESVTSIGAYALAMCMALTEVDMPEQLKEIKTSAFMRSTLLATISNFESCEAIDEQAFDTCLALKEITLPENLKSIDRAAFSGCGIEEITIPNSVETFGSAIFSVCKALNKATLSPKMEEVPAQMFQGSAVKEVIIPEGIKTIANAAFLTTTALDTVEIPSSLETIMYKAFSASALKSIDIPSTVKSIQYGAFSDCEVLESVKVNWTSNIPTIGEDPTGYGMEEDVFPAQFKSEKSIKVPAETKDAYKAVAGWESYSFAE